MLVYCEGNPVEILKSNPVLDQAATREFAQQLFPSEKITFSREGDLSYTMPDDDELIVGCFPGLKIIAAAEFGIDYPSRLDAWFVEACPGHDVYMHVMHSAVDFFGYAVWKGGQLQRALSLSPDSGIMDYIGDKLPFEQPYWNGEHPALDPEEEEEYPFPFHPLELGEAALAALFGYQLEGFINPELLEPETIPLLHFKRKKSWWRFGK